ncbi:MAG: hypothetical protein AAF208_03060 [Cyanobacteria bacterium P01_A01_bin.45]
MNLPEVIKQRLEVTQNSFQKNSDAFQSWNETAAQTAKEAINRLTSTTEQTKQYVENTVQTTIGSSIGDWFAEHPGFLKILQFLNWGVNHPILSIILIVFALALIFSLVKAVVKLIEGIGLSILQIPFKLIQSGLKYLYIFLKEAIKWVLSKFNLIEKQQINQSNSQQNLNFISIQKINQKTNLDKQQRLSEITIRLSEIQQEQNELLAEASSILNSDIIPQEIISSEIGLDKIDNLDIKLQNNNQYL